MCLSLQLHYNSITISFRNVTGFEFLVIAKGRCHELFIRALHLQASRSACYFFYKYIVLFVIRNPFIYQLVRVHYRKTWHNLQSTVPETLRRTYSHITLSALGSFECTTHGSRLIQRTKQFCIINWLHTPPTNEATLYLAQGCKLVLRPGLEPTLWQYQNLSLFRFGLVRHNTPRYNNWIINV